MYLTSKLECSHFFSTNKHNYKLPPKEVLKTSGQRGAMLLYWTVTVTEHDESVLKELVPQCM